MVELLTDGTSGALDDFPEAVALPNCEFVSAYLQHVLSMC
jgi:hypothetical protein